MFHKHRTQKKEYIRGEFDISKTSKEKTRGKKKQNKQNNKPVELQWNASVIKKRIYIYKEKLQKCLKIAISGSNVNMFENETE